MIVHSLAALERTSYIAAEIAAARITLTNAQAVVRLSLDVTRQPVVSELVEVTHLSITCHVLPPLGAKVNTASTIELCFCNNWAVTNPARHL